MNCMNCMNRPIPGTQYVLSPCATCILSLESYYISKPYSDCSESHPDPVYSPWDEVSDDIHDTAFYILHLLDLCESKSPEFAIYKAKLANPEVSSIMIARQLNLHKQMVYAVLHKCPFKQFFSHKIGHAINKALDILISVKVESATAYKILLYKLREPYLSYSDIASHLNIRKQAVQYHINRLLTRHPVLSSAIIIDRRFLRKSIPDCE